jgi:periplasmic protein TonB
VVQSYVMRRPIPAEQDDRGAVAVRETVLAARRELQGVHLVGVALGVSLLVVVGVHFLRQHPAAPAAPTRSAIVKVQLAPAPSPARQQHEIPPRNETPNVEARSDTPVTTPERPVERREAMQLVAVAPTVALETPPAQITLAPSSSQARVAASGVASEFQKVLFAHIERYRQYPDAARQQHLKGIVQVQFAMSRNGTVLGVWVKTSSGEASLDREAMDTVRRAQPLPPIPAALPDPLNILLPVEFGTS